MKRLAIVIAVALICMLPFTLAASADENDDRVTATLRIKLPYHEGKSYQVFQGNNGSFSHSGQNRYAWDFGMPESSPVCAAAQGRVVQVKQDSDRGGMSSEDRGAGNTIILDHGGDYFTQYLHLKSGSATVKEGDLVNAGQVIGLSGHTGYSSVPHLHFQVQDVIGRSLPVQFLDVPGNGIPSLGRSYESHNDGKGVSDYSGESQLPLDTFIKNSILLMDSNVPGHLLNTGSAYNIKGIVRKPCKRVVLYLMSNSGGKPLESFFAAVGPDGGFSLSFDLGLLPKRISAWSHSRSQSNILALALAPVEQNGSYWSTVSVLVALRD